MIYTYMKNIIIFIILFFINFPIFAKNLSNLELKIIGNKNLDFEFIETIIDVNTELEDEELTNYIIKELFSTGYFKSVTAEINSNILTINLIENPVINKIYFVNNERFNSDELLLLIENYTDTATYNQNMIDQITRNLTQHYKSFGFNLIEVTSSIKDINDDQVNLYFEINEGEVTRIKKINIVGNENYSKRKIKSILRSTETKFYKIISGRSKYNQNLIYLDQQRIIDFYKDRGYKNVVVESSVSEFIKKSNNVVLSYFISEGERYRINDIKINFEETLEDKAVTIPKDFISNELNIKMNKVYNKTKIQKSADKIYDYIQNQGMIFVDLDILEDEKDNFLNLTFLVKEINENYISEINITGNTRTKDKVIRREMKLSEGDPYIPSKLNISKNNIKKLNFFSSVDTEILTNNDGKVKINVDVDEKPTGEFNIGATYDTFEGVALVSGLTENNILGDGRRLSLGFNTSDDNAGINFEVTEPYIFHKKINLLYNLNFKTRDFTSSSGYKLDTQTAGIGIKYQLTDNLSHFSKLDYSINNYKSIQSSASDSIKELSGENVLFKLSNIITYSTLDSFFRPTEGSILKFANRYAIDDYLSNKLSYDKFYNLNKRIFSIRNEIANIYSLQSSDIADSNKFSLGGRSLRGFDIYGVGPRNSSASYVGGNNLLLSQIDYMIPLSESENNLIDLVTFIDVGKIYSNKTNPTDSKESVRISSGIGFNINTLIGPLSLTWAWPIQSESYDKEKRFVFSIGWGN